MELSDSDFRHDSEDSIGIALAQVFGLIMAALAVLTCAAHYVGVAAEYGRTLEIPYGGAVGPVLGLLALVAAAGLPGRYRHVWFEPRARGRIVLGLAQIAVSAAVVALPGFVLAGGWVDLTLPGQSIQAWLCNGLLLGCGAQIVICLGAFALLMLKREMP